MIDKFANRQGDSHDETLGSDRFGLVGDLKVLIDSLPALVHTGLPNGDLDFFNHRWLEYVGRPLSALTGWQWTSCIHPEDLDGVVAAWKTSLVSGHDFQYEARVRRADGKYRWMFHEKVPVRDEGGNIVKWYGSSIDIEDRKRGEERATRKEQDLREMIDSIPQHIFVLDRSGIVLNVNRLILEYTGESREGLKGLDSIEQNKIQIHPDDLARFRDFRKGKLSEDRPFELEWRVRNKHGIYRWFLFRYNPVRDESGEVYRWFGTATDIQKIKTAETELRLAVDTIASYLHTARPDGLVDYLNRRWLEYLGMPLDEALGRCDVLDIRDTSNLDLHSWDFRSVIHPDDVDEVTAVWNRAVQMKVAEDAYARIRRHDGVYRWFMFRTCPQFDENGNLVRWYGADFDIEDLKQAEEKLRQQELEICGQLRQVINTMPGLGWTARPDGQADFLNRQWLDYSGLSIEEAIGWGFLVTIHPDDFPKMMKDWQRALQTGEFFETEGRVRRHDGEYRHFQFRGSAVRDSNGNIVKWIGIDTDVEDRRRIEDALRESEQNLRLMIEAIPASIWCVDPVRGNPVYANQRFCKYVGIRVETISEWNWLSYVHPDDREQTRKAWEQNFEHGEFYDVVHRLRRFDGTYRWFQTVAEPLRDRENRIIHWYGLNIDIEESRTLAEALRAAQMRLSRATQIATVAELSASIAHEVNQPLGAVVANGDACEMWLSSDPPNIERARLAVQRIIRDGKAAGEVIQRIRALFKQAIPKKLLLDLNDVIAEVLPLVANEAARKSVRIETDLLGDLPKTPADRVQMQQLIINLSHNGIDAMESLSQRPKVLLLRSLVGKNDTVQIEVCDQGAGIEDAERIFEPFFTTKEKGMGMGLSICRSIVDAHGGNLWAMRNEGKGTTFHFTIPISEEASK